MDKKYEIDKYRFLYHGMEYIIPERMRKPLTRYIEDKKLPGGFLQAVIKNDLSDAIGRADAENMHNLPAYCNFFYNHTPHDCWGSAEKMKAWVQNE
jgi:hypothetical protein